MNPFSAKETLGLLVVGAVFALLVWAVMTHPEVTGRDSLSEFESNATAKWIAVSFAFIAGVYGGSIALNTMYK